MTIVVAVALMLIGLFVGGLSTGSRLLAIGLGAAGLFVGVAMLAKVLVPPLASVLGWPATRIGGAAGKLARGNAMRNPTRTASTASALMIGLALVTLVSVLATGLKSTFESSVSQLFKADYALTATNNFSPVSIASAQALRGVPGVRVVSGVRAGQGRAFGGKINVSGVSPDISRVIDVKWQQGSPAVPAELGQSGAFVSKDYAKELHLHVGSPIAVETPAGRVMHLELRGIFAPPKGGSPYGDVTISTQRFDAEYENPQNVFTFVNIAGGVTAANTQRLEHALAGFPDAKIQTESQFKSSQEQGIDTLLNLLYVLLSLSIMISLFGIVNTLVLTVFERTRELGMLRAVGMSRRQLRRMIRHESIVTALIGAALGIPARDRARDHGRAGDRIPHLHDPRGHARGVRDRRDPRRHPRCDLPGPARRASERAGGAAVRVGVAGAACGPGRNAHVRLPDGACTVGPTGACAGRRDAACGVSATSHARSHPAALAPPGTTSAQISAFASRSFAYAISRYCSRSLRCARSRVCRTLTLRISCREHGQHDRRSGA